MANGPSYGFDTLQIHAGSSPDPATGSRQTPIYQSTAFVFQNSEHAARLFNLQEVGYIYSRLTNPTIATLQERIAILEAEIAKLAYRARDKYIGDPHFSEINQSLFLEDVFLQKLANEVSMDGLIEPKTADNLIEKSKDTVLITAADKEGNSISLIFSIFDPFGSGLCSERYGLIFHNRGAGFTLQKGHPNELKSGKRPFHTIIPAMLKEKNGSLMPFGVMGGQYQANGHARILSNILDYRMDLQQALNFQRSFYFNGYLSLEEGYRADVERSLSNMGHKIERPKKPIGGAQLVKYDTSGILIGASDPRKDGCALGL